MFSKLKNAGTDFSKDQELKNLKFTIDDQIQDFIIEPMKEKFLIIDGKSEAVDIKKNPIKSINLSSINNKSNTIDEIEIDDIIKPNSYSINSLMEYYGSCILKTQTIPTFIRYAVINKNHEQIIKANNI